MSFRYRKYSLELKEPFGTAHGTRTHTDGVLISLSRGGFTGFGEVFMPPYYPENQESMTAFFKLVDSAKLLEINDLNDALDFVNSVSAENKGAKTAIDIALHDLFGKENGSAVSKWKLKNGSWSIRSPNVSIGTAKDNPLTSYTIGIDTLEVMVRKAREAKDFSILKIKLNGKNDISVIEAIKEVSDQKLYVDANQGWDDIKTALNTAEALIDLGVGLIEQPFRTGELDKARVLKQKCPVPIVADEDVQKLDDIPLLARCYDGVNIKLMKAGGIRESARMIAAAHANGLKVLLGCMTESSVGISAAAQLAHLADWCDLDGNLLIANDTCTGVETIEGSLVLSGEPGIGITDDSRLTKYLEGDD